MSDKLNAALSNVEKARNAALETAITERAYRLCAVLDADGPVQRGVNRARRILNGQPTSEAKPAKK